MLIALAATVVLAALWLVALRPKDDAASDSAPIPPQIEAIDKAKDAAANTDAATAATQAASAAAGESAPAAQPATANPATANPNAPAPLTAAKADEERATATSANAERRVLSAMGANKVVVLLFQNSKGADDRAVRRIVRGLDRHNGRVVVDVAPVSRVGAYESVTRGITVTQSPTTVIIDRDRRARLIVGLSDKREMSQAVGDALSGR